MLFNSHAFLFVFLPLALLVYFQLGKRLGVRAALGAMTASSFAFYAYWDPRNLRIIVPSLLVNFALGHLLTATYGQAARAELRRLAITVAVLFNLTLLGYFKYANFFLSTAATVTGADVMLRHIVLPLGISFFTFEQIAYTVDAYRGRSRAYGFLEYCYFVSFFPHLIAGPIIQHNELLEQVSEKTPRLSWNDFALGLTIFLVGLFKKVAIADTVAVYVAPVYDQVPSGLTPSFLSAWLATFGYSLQLYFDFSGYSDMAIGLARMVNVRLPMNFNSPYKARNIIEFWRRWHMTLSRFLRDYLYVSLGGNRHGKTRRYANLLLTMLLGGLWHGAGWGFVIWGGLNGIFLVINHAFRKLRGAGAKPEPHWVWLELSTLFTFVCIMLSRVFFRSAGLAEAWIMLRGLFGLQGWGVLAGTHLPVLGLFMLLYAFCRLAPNTQEWLAHKQPVLQPVKGPAWVRRFAFRPAYAAALGAVGLATLLMLTQVSEFLYFQF